jgi:release factor glutamine methyltransferase
LTLHERLAGARAQLEAAGIAPAEAAIDVDVYTRTILGWDRARVITSQQAPVPPALEPRFSEWLERRERHEPTAYIVGVREFWGLDFHVTPAVLIPRPETELVVEEALTLIRSDARRRPASREGGHMRLADIGTGSGCIAVSIAHERHDCSVVATDVSADALAIATRNALRHRVDRQVKFVCTSYLDGVDETFDLITANPPYVRDGDKRGLSKVVLHEPDVALFGGVSGLRDIEGVLDTAVAKLRPGGWFVMEFGFGQEDDVRELAGKRPELRVDHLRADLQGLARTAIIERL